MIRQISRVISVVFHPVFIPVIAIFMLTHLHYLVAARLIAETKWIFIAAYTISLTVVPLLGTMLMLKKYTLSELSNLSNNERTSASMVLAVVYFFIAFTFQTLFVDKILQVFVIALGVSALVLSISSRFFRISFHAFGWSGLLVLAMAIAPTAALNMNYIIALIFVIGAIVCSARLVLEAHTHKEVYFGYLIGFICNLLVYGFYYGI